MKRRAQRIELSTPLEACFGSVPVKLIDLSTDGAAVEHVDPLPVGSTAKLAVKARWSLQVIATTRHCVVLNVERGSSQVAYRSGLEFRDLSDDAVVAVESLLMDEAMRLVRRWEANAQGIAMSGALSASTPARPGGSSRYVWMRLIDGSWQRSTTLDPNQPLDGFAVDSDESPEHIAMLCETYAKADEAERKLIRSVAQLAIAERLQHTRA